MDIKRILSHPFTKGTLLLTCIGFASRILGFFFRIFLAHTLGAEHVGIYQLVLPFIGICVSAFSLSLQTGLSKLVAAYADSREHTLSFLYAALFLGLSLSALCCFVLFFLSDWICLSLLNEPRCLPLLRMLLLSLPFSTIHTCICGYYYGKSMAKAPAYSQLVEQLVRISTVFFFWYIGQTKQQTLTVLDVAAGSITSELASSLYLFLQYQLQKTPGQQRQLPYCFYLKQLTVTALPLSANRLTITALQSLESVFIPLSLSAFGFSSSQALSAFGTLTGMALPFLMFPFTLIHSACVLLLPEISRLASQLSDVSHKLPASSSIKQEASDVSLSRQEYSKQLFSLIRSILLFGLFFGLFSACFLALFGPVLGSLFFRSRLAGRYIRFLSVLAPFLSVNNITASILNGLGKLCFVFLHSLASILIRLSGVFWLIPVWGMEGYLLGLFLAELFLTLLHLYALYRTCKACYQY